MKILSFQEYFRHGLSLNQYSTFNSPCLISVIHILSIVIVMYTFLLRMYSMHMYMLVVFFRNIQYIARIFIGFSTKFLLLVTTGSIMYNSPQIRPQNLYSIIAEITSLLNVDPSPRAYIWCGF